MIEVEPREKLRKLKLPTEFQENAESILGRFLREVDIIPEITDMLYAMGRAVKIKMSLRLKVSRRNGKQKPSNGNRRKREKK